MAGRAKRTLIGCGIGCGVLVVILIAAALGFGAWISKKGAPLEPQRLLGADTTGYVEWNLRLDDPGTEGFVQLVIEAFEAERQGNTRQLPPWLGRLIGNRQNRDASRQIRELFPVVGAWTLTPAAGSAGDATLFSVSPTGLGNRLALADWMMGFAAGWDDDNIVHEYRDEDVYQVPAGRDRRQTFFIRANTVFFTSDVSAAELAVDRLHRDDPSLREATRLDRLFDETAAERTLRGAVANDRGELPRLWRRIAGEGAGGLLTEVRGVTLAGGLEQDGSLAVTLGLRGPDPRWAAAHAEQLAEAVTRGLAWTELDLRATADSEGDVVRIELRAVGLVESLGRVLELPDHTSGVRIEL